MVGSTISHYRVLALLGSGGMGVVYLAEDTRLHRKVALKFLKDTSTDGDGKERLLREAEAESTLDHPNIATVYEFGEWEGRLFIAMGYYSGETLKQRLERGPLPIDEAVGIAAQIAAGLEAAHASGIVHRDLKPANVIVSSTGQVKILDFGLAKMLSQADAETQLRVTASGTTIGTISYMAPEQALGEEVDQRADVWALGALMFEMLAGRPPFDGSNAAAVLLSVVSQEAPSVSEFRQDVPGHLQQVIARALVKHRNDRTITAGEIRRALETQGSTQPEGAGSASARIRRSRTVMAAVAVTALAAAVAGWAYLKQRADERWVRSTVIPEMRRLMDEGNFVAAFERARAARHLAADDPEFTALWTEITRPITVTSDPPGAEVSIAPYGGHTSGWTPLGETPLEQVAVPRGVSRIRLSEPGYLSAEDLLPGGPGGPVSLRVKLSRLESAPSGMVRADGPEEPVAMYLAPGSDPVDVAFPDYWIDRHEVTNREFKAFVDAGGYQRREYWQHEFVKDGKTLLWQDAMALFRDATGRPGPATWQVGAYPEGQDEYPVTGVSWYEAAAYARFAGKSLLTLPHFYRAAGFQMSSQIVPFANFAGKGPMRVGATNTLNRFGAFDLAGNVKEWVLNPAGGDLRCILGGGWDEPAYMFSETDARPALERAPNFGFRCARYDTGDGSIEKWSGIVTRPSRDYTAERPVPASVFDAYRRFFAYDRTPVKATLTSTDDSNTEWRVEVLTYPAAYTGETITARMYVPRNARPPFQTVLFQGGAGQYNLRVFQPQMAVATLAPIIRSGRAVVYPVVKGTFERGSDQFTSTTSKEGTLWRDYMVAFYKDLARTLDYLETRPDVARDRIAFLGLSRGAALSPLLLSLEPQRVSAAVLWIPGLYLSRPAPEVDIINFAPRVTQPVLMLSGRYDFVFPEQRSQLPFFTLLGSPADLKRRIAYDTGHNLPQTEMIKETLDWLDRHLGQVQR